MFRKLLDALGSSEVQVGLATIMISLGLGTLRREIMRYQDQIQAQQAELAQLRVDRARAYGYPTREDVDPLGRAGDVDQADELAPAPA